MQKRTQERHRRSDATKAAIVAAARERFAADGYERATIRAIAAQARIDPAMVMRYFGSKEGLFAAAAQFDLRMPNLAAVPRQRLGVALVTHFLERWEEDDTFMALLRAAATNEPAGERMRAIFASQVAPALAPVLGTSANARARAGLISSQVLGLALTRYVLRLPAVVALQRKQIVEQVGPLLQALLVP
ncbi:MAG TPA: TetR family transcriptional regulator [Burkholderiales bacterium]|nr:TetR family transcriptional regulator [Burkholderiales bacterium]